MRIVAGKWRGRRIEAPSGEDVRPTLDRVREAWMSILQPEIPDARVVDVRVGLALHLRELRFDRRSEDLDLLRSRALGRVGRHRHGYRRQDRRESQE